MTGSHENHQHSHIPKNFGRAFVIGIVLNIIFIIAEIIYGLKVNSLALLSDAGHNVSDVFALGLAFVGVILAKSKPSDRFTYGLESASIVIALTNAVSLLVVVGGIAWEAVNRFNNPDVNDGSTVIMVAMLGVVINGVTAMLFMSGKKNDLNIRGVFLHMATDALVSLGVAISGIIILNTRFTWIDPLTSLIISLVIIIGTWGLLKDSIGLSLHAVPRGIEIAKVKKYLADLKGVREIHDLHIWAIGTNHNVASVHLIMPTGHPGDKFIAEISHELDHQFNIGHVTIQIEVGDIKECKLASEERI